MAGKVRVHQLAKELGVPAKELLVWLNTQGEFVKSASSTLESRVARRLRTHYAAKNQAGGRSGGDVKAPSPSKRVTTDPPVSAGLMASGPPHFERQLTRVEAENICRRFRKASATGQDQAAINKLYLDCEAQYRVSREALRNAIAEDLVLHPEEYAPSRQPRKRAATAQPRRGRPVDSPAGALARASSTSLPHDAHAQVGRPRPRADNLPPCVGVANPQSVADLIMNLDSSQDDRSQVVARVQTFAPDGAAAYGYLAWRYSAAHRDGYPERSTTAPHHDLALIAHVVDAETQVIDQMTRTHGHFLEQRDLAKRVLESEFRELVDVDDVGRSAADELRHVRARDHFLRRAAVLTVASPDCDQRLWDMISQLRPPTPSQLVETSAPLESAIARLNGLIADVESLFAANKFALDGFFRQSHTELRDLQAGRYDFLRQFHDVDPSVRTTARRTINRLAFALLPRGEKLRAFLDDIRSSGRYGGYKVDEARLTVLEDIEKHFGADRCRWHEGTELSTGVNNEYLVLTIKSANGSGEHAVAISPLAGRHATYVVRCDCADADWVTIFAHPKSEARLQGARKLLFTANDHGVDQYRAMRDKVIALLECPRHEFPQHPLDTGSKTPPHATSPTAGNR